MSQLPSLDAVITADELELTAQHLASLQLDTGMIPCADAAEIAGVGIKAMRNGLRSGAVPGGTP